MRDSCFAGFNYSPPIWIGDPLLSKQGLTVSALEAEVFSKEFLCGVRIKVSKGGAFVFDFSKWKQIESKAYDKTTIQFEEIVYPRMRFMNLFLVCLLSSIDTNVRHFIPILFVDKKIYSPAHAFSTISVEIVYRAGSEYYDRRSRHYSLSITSLDATVDLVDKTIQDNFQDVAVLAELLLHSAYLHESGRYEASHIAAWAIIENCLNKKWKMYLEELNDQQSTKDKKSKFIDSNRMKKLTGSDFTASVVSEFLSLGGLLTFENYKRCDLYSNVTNKWLNQLKTITRV